MLENGISLTEQRRTNQWVTVLSNMRPRKSRGEYSGWRKQNFFNVQTILNFFCLYGADKIFLYPANLFGDHFQPTFFFLKNFSWVSFGNFKRTSPFSGATLRLRIFRSYLSLFEKVFSSISSTIAI
jgi:hypothetical protein